MVALMVRGVCLLPGDVTTCRLTTYSMKPLASTKVKGRQLTITTLGLSAERDTVTPSGSTSGTAGEIASQGGEEERRGGGGGEERRRRGEEEGMGTHLLPW